MAVTLRLARHGQKKRPFYRIVATDKESRRDGRYLEIVGTYNPMVDPPLVSLKEDRVRYWVESGAQTSGLVASIIKKNIPNFLEERTRAKLEKIQASRKARKARGGGKAREKSPSKIRKKENAAKKAASK